LLSVSRAQVWFHPAEIAFAPESTSFSCFCAP
jgi:hypothetical protein